MSGGVPGGEDRLRDSVHAHIIVYGFVQGVLFRLSVREEAERLGIRGWAANRWDGGVETVAEGDKASVDKFINWLYKSPSHTRVDNLEVTWGEYSGAYDSFGIR